MEFLTFAPIPFAEMLGEDVTPHPAQWDAMSRDIGIVSGLDRWIVGLRGQAETDREEAARENDPERAARRRRRAEDADALLRIVELLSGTLDALSGEASWPDWSARLRGVVDQWLGRERDREAVGDVVADLGGLAFLGGPRALARGRAGPGSALRMGAPAPRFAGDGRHSRRRDGRAGRPALPRRRHPRPRRGRISGRAPPRSLPPRCRATGPRRAAAEPEPAPLPPAVRTPRGPARRQLSLFDDDPPPPPPDPPVAVQEPIALPTAQDRLLAERRAFQRAIGQATERLILSYPRADARTGRERMPSLFFVAAAAAREGRSAGGGGPRADRARGRPRRHAARSHPRPLGARPAARAHGRPRGRARHLRRLRLLQAVAPERAARAGRATSRPTTASSRSPRATA